MAWRTTSSMETIQNPTEPAESSPQGFGSCHEISFSGWIPIVFKTSLFWLIAGLATVLATCGPQTRMVGFWGFLLLWLLVTGDLLSLAGVVKIVVEITKKQREKVSGQTIQLVVFGTAKLACLLGIILVLKVGRYFPPVSLFMGISTLVIVPILSGVIADA